MVCYLKKEVRIEAGELAIISVKKRKENATDKERLITDYSELAPEMFYLTDVRKYYYTDSIFITIYHTRRSTLWIACGVGKENVYIVH